MNGDLKKSAAKNGGAHSHAARVRADISDLIFKINERSKITADTKKVVSRESNNAAKTKS